MIGSGSRGAVFRATRGPAGTGSEPGLFAVKVMPHGRSRPRVQDRLLDSARKALSIQHPSLATLVEVGADELQGVAYLVSELAPGTDLARRLAVSGAIPFAEAAFVGSCVARALGALHAAGALHRDVKPAHVVVDARSAVRLVETGFPPIVASTSGHGETVRSPIAGSPAYAAPEQSRDPDAATGASDMYSLGATLFHLVAGRPPFVAESPVALLVQHATRPPPPLGSLEPAVPEEFARVVDALLSKDPSARPSASEVATVLESLAGEEAGRPGGRDRSAEPGRKSPFSRTRLRLEADLAAAVVRRALASRRDVEAVIDVAFAPRRGSLAELLGGSSGSLAEALVERGVASARAIEELQREIASADARRRDAAFGRFAMEAGFARRGEIERVLAETGDSFSSLAESMVRHGALTRENALVVARASARHLREVETAAIERLARERGVAGSAIDSARKALLELPPDDDRSLLDLLLEAGSVTEALAWELAREAVRAALAAAGDPGSP